MLKVFLLVMLTMLCSLTLLACLTWPLLAMLAMLCFLTLLTCLTWWDIRLCRVYSSVRQIMLTLGSLLRFSSRESYFLSFMPSRRLFKTEHSFVRHRRLLTKLRANAVPVMRACKRCKNFKSSCEVEKDFDKCINCVNFDRKCDLIIFEIKWNKV